MTAPEPRQWVIELPAGLKTLSLNKKLHWSEQNRRAQEIKKAAWGMALHQKVPHLKSATIEVEFRPPDRRNRDHDNIPAASGKHAIDGLVAAGVLTDDAPPNIRHIAYAIGVPCKGGRLVLTVTEVTS